MREHLHSQVNSLLNQGATLLLGGYLPERKGYFYPPSILKIEVDSPAYSFDEELFGPVALIIDVPNEELALKGS